ncbi:tetratricopeptide repeat protein [Micromonospora carbonacea]|uniref:Tetratricopeptide repeat protein n=1 Tax=Micromonospora carbonacea TaxID=47853 RepID=A0A7H8XMX4_9ACTN|nr:tetratricopeptide repeat protein [Micromonospora carbonacea]MBB5825617.1 tetratricopeptide (TPR) repeat protein [Micromonospora carbonacea]QLD26356.1 tetratricopeptide repeat protein [Micromonospora carbonacea]
MAVHLSSHQPRLRLIGGALFVAAVVAAALALDATVVATVTTVLGAVAGVLGVWLPLRQRTPQAEGVAAGPPRRSVTAPTGDAPRVLHGRETELARLRSALARPGGRFRVLAGLGGVGKSALALALHEHAAARRGRSAWWISARTPETFADGIVHVAETLGATPADADELRAGTARARDLWWELLSRARRGWLLVIDDADELRVLGALDGTGWLRPSGQGLVLVTSRVGSPHPWGRAAEVIRLGPLAEGPAAQMLLDLTGGGSEAAARRLARRLGGLPLALKVAGSDIGWEFSRWESLADYESALDAGDVTGLLHVDRGVGGPPDPRQVPATTFEISLASLTGEGLPHATPLLRLLSCYAPNLPIPVDLLACEAVDALLGGPADEAGRQRHLHTALRGLAQLSLVAEGHLERHGTRIRTASLHPLVSEASRSRAAGAPHQAAVEAVVAALAPLRSDDSRTWPLAAIVSPHVRQLLDTSLAYLDDEHLTALLDVAARLVAAAAWSGAADASGQLASHALARTTPLDEDHPARLNLRAELAWATGRNGDWDTARTMLASVLRTWESQADPPPLPVLDVRHKLAWSIGRTGDWESTRARLTAVGEARRRLLGADHPDTLHTRCCLAWAMWRTGSPAEAEAEYRSVIADRRAVLGDDHVEVLDAYHSLAEGYVLDNRHEEAEAVLRTVVAARARLLGPDHPETLDNCPRYWLGRALQGQGRHAEATDLLERLLREQTRWFGVDHPATAATRACLTGRPGTTGTDTTDAR